MIVVDSSVVVDALTLARAPAELRDLLRDQDLHAPSLLDYEVVSVLRGLTLGGRITASRAMAALEDFDDLRIQRWSPVGALRRRAFGLRDTMTAYDAAYVALAEALDCPLLTRDHRLARSPAHSAVVRAL